MSLERCCSKTEPRIYDTPPVNGVRHVTVTCLNCDTKAELDVDFENVPDPSRVGPVAAAMDLVEYEWSKAVKRTSLARYGLAP